MTKRRRLLWLAAALAAVLLGAYALLWWTAPRVTGANFERIEVGMMLAEVEALLGGPAGNYADDELVFGSYPELFEGWPNDRLSDDYREWLGPDVAILVKLDAGGRVVAKVCGETARWVNNSRSDLLSKLRRWLGITR